MKEIIEKLIKKIGKLISKEADCSEQISNLVCSLSILCEIQKQPKFKIEIGELYYFDEFNNKYHISTAPV